MSADKIRELICREQQCFWNTSEAGSSWQFSQDVLAKQEIWQWHNHTSDDLILKAQLALGYTYQNFYDSLLQLKVSRLENDQKLPLIEGNLGWLAQAQPTFTATLAASASGELDLDFYHSVFDFLQGQKIKNTAFTYAWHLTIEASPAAVIIDQPSATGEASLPSASDEASTGGEIVPYPPPVPVATAAAEVSLDVDLLKSNIAESLAVLEAKPIELAPINRGNSFTLAKNQTSLLSLEQAIKTPPVVLGETTRAALVIDQNATSASVESRPFLSSCKWFWWWLLLIILLIGFYLWWKRCFFKK